MKNGILREDEGFDLLVDGAARTCARTRMPLKRSNRMSIVEIREEATGTKQTMLRTGVSGDR
jgi:hypothetical protein